MKIYNINSNLQHNNPLGKTFGKQNIKKEDGYVIIPEKKYKRDKMLEYGIIGVLLLYEILSYIFSEKPKFIK